ncbi:MAG TPA: nucleotide disphospho-sugar-binding domain-containing protein [Solirubrobacteraceae bacterium]|nr:nucleotide disphospho-sugar-binding domain-containing protein [Solirubrobacteraceae bacterium]
MSRFLFTLWPFTGHLLPQMSLAQALRERGHEVAFYSGDAVRATVEDEGFAFFGFDRLDQERGFAAVRAMEEGGVPGRPGRGRVLPLLRAWLADTIPDQLADLDDVLAAFAPDAIATDLSLWGPVVVLADRGPVPVALSSTFMGPLIPGRDAPAFGFGLPAPRTRRARGLARAITALTELAATPMRRQVDAIRAEHGLPPLGTSVNRATARLPLYLVGNIRELDYGRRDLPASVHYIGNNLWFPPPTPEETAWLDAIPADRPWVHVTESTLAFGRPFLLAAAAEALAGEAVEVIVTSGKQRPADLGPLPGNVHVAPWISHGALLPRCAAVVTVGGKATILAAMEAGVPMVLVPTSWDKPDNARRVTRVGAAVRLPARACTPEALRDAVGQVLHDPRHARAAQEMARRLAAAPGAEGGAELLETLVPAARRPAYADGGVQ